MSILDHPVSEGTHSQLDQCSVIQDLQQETGHLKVPAAIGYTQSEHNTVNMDDEVMENEDMAGSFFSLRQMPRLILTELIRSASQSRHL